MDGDIRGARRSAMAALIAGVGNTNFSRRKFVRQTKKTAIGAGVGAETFLTEKINSHESANEKKRDRHRDRRECFPEIRGDEVIGKFREQRLRC